MAQGTKPLGLAPRADNDVRGEGAAAFEREPWFARFPVPAADGHKHDRGRALVLAGRRHETGAARLAADAALRVGAGLVTLVASPAAADICAMHATAIMVAIARDPDEWSETIRERRAGVVALGMGLEAGERTRGMVAAALASDAAVVLDAGALTAHADAPDTLFERIGEREAATVMTPHAGEFARLFGERGAREAAELSGALVLLKGPVTRIATPDGATTESRHGPPWLATAGTGDVLAGMVAGLLAQGCGATDAAMAAVWLHGEAARRLGPGMTADDLPPALHPVLREVMLARLERVSRA